MQADVYTRHIKNYSKHWWFQARKEIIKSLIKKYIKKNNHRKKFNILDFGAGSGVNINMLSKIGFVNIYEPHKKTRNYLKKNFNDSKKYKILDNIKKKKFDLIVLADVLEHIKNDRIILDKLYKCLNNDGFLLITVPAYNFLFSKKDEKLGHFRRYRKLNIIKIFRKFKIIKLSYFNFILFIPITIMIIINKIFKKDFIDKVEKPPNNLLNQIMFRIFKFENIILRFINFPFGVSIIGFFKKK